MIEFKEFSVEFEDWNLWSIRVYQAQISASGCADELTANEDDEKKLGRSDFDSNGVTEERLRKADQVWVSLITSCKGVTFGDRLGIRVTQ